MSLTRAECALIRVVVNRALLGPAWFNDLPESPLLRAMFYETKKQTREWMMANVVRELNNLLPADQRITAAGIQAIGLQVEARVTSIAAAAPAAPAQDQDSTVEQALNLVRHLPVLQAEHLRTAPEPESAPPAQPDE